MSDATFERSAAGTVNVTVKPSSSGLNYLTLRWSYQGKQRSLGLRLIDSSENRAVANQVAAQIQLDIVTGQFDETLDKYRLKRDKPAKSTKVKLSTVSDFWFAYCDSKKELWKENTKRKHDERFKVICKAINPNKIKFLDLNPISFNQSLVKVTKQNRAVFETLGAIFDWAIKSAIIEPSPNRFKAILNDLPKHNWQSSPIAKSFTHQQKYDILDWFLWNSYQYYWFILFLFSTGCRPSEAVGLKWEQVIDASDGKSGYILFDRSVSFRSGKAIYNVGSKNNKTRKFPINKDLAALLVSVPILHANGYVFTTPGRNATNPDKSHIHLPSLIKNHWKKCMEHLKLDNELYCCRDTFISEQVKKGVPIAVVGLWCDTSTKQIEKRYLDKQTALDIVPI